MSPTAGKSPPQLLVMIASGHYHILRPHQALQFTCCELRSQLPMFHRESCSAFGFRNSILRGPKSTDHFQSMQFTFFLTLGGAWHVVQNLIKLEVLSFIWLFIRYWVCLFIHLRNIHEICIHAREWRRGELQTTVFIRGSFYTCKEGKYTNNYNLRPYVVRPQMLC